MKGIETETLIVIVALIIGVAIILLFLFGIIKIDLTTLSPP
jgi:uncharacterized membrane protein (Fun14 family)